jgi:hypothetical protein
MPLTAQAVYNAAQLTPSFFGSAVDVDATEEDQLAQALSYIETEVLPGARAEISLPVRRALGNMTSPLDDAGLEALFGVVAPEVKALWDAAETSYARSELNKRVSSNSTNYDQDSDQDRIQGNQRLQKLLDWIAEWRSYRSEAPDANDIPVSMNVEVRAV